MRTRLGRRIVKGRRLQLGVLMAGLLATLLVSASLLFGRIQTDAYHQRLERIDAELNQPLVLLDESQAGFRQTQQTFELGVQPTTSSQQAGSIFAQALNQGAEAQRTWDQFGQTPIRFEGEQQARDAVDAAITADNAAGQALGVAVLVSAPDPVVIARLKVDQRTAFDQLQNALKHLEGDLYLPALNREVASVGAAAGSAGESLLAMLLGVVGLGLLLTVIGYRRAARVEAASIRERDLQDQIATENSLDAQLQHALDMADSEDHVFGVIERALTRDGAPTADFLLAASDTTSFAHVTQVAEDHARRCGVPSPNECPAARHGQELVFTDSRALDACPYLLDRETLPGAAVCMPVNIAGRTIGVVHEASINEGPPASHRVRELRIIARKAGERLGMLRAFERSEAQAQTDPLTGLLNRRSLEDAVQNLNRQDISYTLAFADLDHFKLLNDAYGHDAGDRALRLFCTVLRANVRPDDIVARYGGEEFVIVLPRCAPAEAVPVLQRVQAALADTVRADRVPTFTVSIGVASTHSGGTFEETLSLADGCLRHAKDQGRNRIVVAGADEPYLGPSSAPLVAVPSDS